VVGVCQSSPGEAEPTHTLVRSTDVGRSYKQAFRIPTAVGQFSHDSGSRALEQFAFGFVHNGGGGSSDTCDVLQNEFARTASVRDVENAEEKPGALSVESCTATGNRQVLAGETGNDAIHASAPSCAVEGEQVRPDRRCIKRSRFHKRDKLAGSTGFPLHVTNGAVSDAEKLACGAESFAEHADPGTEFDGM